MAVPWISHRIIRTDELQTVALWFEHLLQPVHAIDPQVFCFRERVGWRQPLRSSKIVRDISAFASKALR